MIHCNLATLLAQRNLKISKVYQDTGISRTTLTALAYNHAQGISPTDLILHVPVDVTWKKEWYADHGTDERYETLLLTVTERGKEKQYPMCLKTLKQEIILSFDAPEEEPDMPVTSAAEIEKCKAVIDTLPVECIADLVNSMMKDLSGYDDEAAVSFSWPFHTGW